MQLWRTTYKEARVIFMHHELERRAYKHTLLNKTTRHISVVLVWTMQETRRQALCIYDFSENVWRAHNKKCNPTQFQCCYGLCGYLVTVWWTGALRWSTASGVWTLFCGCSANYMVNLRNKFVVYLQRINAFYAYWFAIFLRCWISISICNKTLIFFK